MDSNNSKILHHTKAQCKSPGQILVHQTQFKQSSFRLHKSSFWIPILCEKCQLIDMLSLSSRDHNVCGGSSLSSCINWNLKLLRILLLKYFTCCAKVIAIAKAFVNHQKLKICDLFACLTNMCLTKYSLYNSSFSTNDFFFKYYGCQSLP